MAITTADDYQAFTGSTVSDSICSSALLIAVAQLERWAGRVAGGFESASVTEYFDGPDHDTIQLSCWPVSAVASVSYLTAKDTWTAIDAATYDTRDVSGLLYFVRPTLDDYFGDADGAGFWKGRQNWKVVYTGGFSTVPKDLVALVWDMMTAILLARGTDTNLQSESNRDYSYTLAPFKERYETWAASAGGFRTGVL